MSYEKHHVLDFCIEDEQLTNNDREVSVFVDSLEMCNIEIGNSVTVRTDENGLHTLVHALERAITKIEEVRYNKVNDAMDAMTEAMNPVTPTAAAVSAPHIQSISAVRSEVQSVDPYDSYLPNDPLKW
tara:strand:+ start:394 stop:777 length:384 start_codon:yes stop_codon:yes gene_type:complete